MIYDRFGVKGVCRGCGTITNWYVNGFYPLCPECAKELAKEIEEATK